MTNKERVNNIITEFYLLYGAFDSSTGVLMGMRPPETIQGMADWWRAQVSTALDDREKTSVGEFVAWWNTRASAGDTGFDQIIYPYRVDEYLASKGEEKK